MAPSREVFLVSFLVNWIVPIVVGAAAVAVFMVADGPSLPPLRVCTAILGLFFLSVHFALFSFSIPSGVVSFLLSATAARFLAGSLLRYLVANALIGAVLATLWVHFTGGPLAANKVLVPAIALGSAAGYLIAGLLVWGVAKWLPTADAPLGLQKP